LHTLQRAAEALGCRLVYALVPDQPLAETVRKQAELVTDRQLANVEQTMRLEDQAVQGKAATKELRNRVIEDLLRRPARLWDGK
jgi:predicted DNA-binding mobile mystery protein A